MAPIRIFIVEDELLISASLKSQLQNYGYEVLGSCTRGEMCLEEIHSFILQGNEPDIVLMDIHLRGDIDGIETARKVKEISNCAIIFLTGQSSKEIYNRSFTIKPLGYLLKPIDIEQTKITIEIASYQRKIEIENKEYQKTIENLLEKQTKESTKQLSIYRTIIDNSSVGLAILQHEKYIFVNEKTTEILGYTVTELLELTPTQIAAIYFSEGQKKVLNPIPFQIMEMTPFKRHRIRIIRKNGKIKWAETLIKPIQFSGMPAIHQTFIEMLD
jgi:PAS domain S-box-containing protein